ncbi:metallophosphoesterase [Akkermansiaceae bacterium]|nr:metallophosphoesterase [Akkermansiaceae bacterium]
MKISRRFLIRLSPLLFWQGSAVRILAASGEPQLPFGKGHPELDSLAAGEWWKKKPQGKNPPPPMKVPRDEVVAFALYTADRGALKMTAQLYPLMPDEAREARLEFERDGKWVEAARAEVLFPGWSAHFRIDGWDDSKDVRYRVRHGQEAMFEGTVRKDPKDKAEIVVANMSCNSSRTTGLRPEIVGHLLHHDPDLLFFAGDQTYRHTEHTAGWIEFGLQFRDLMRDRPTICIPDDHDVGHPNLWGAGGKKSERPDGADGGYFYPPAYVNMVQRQQSWNLPDAVDPAPVDQGIGVYFTRLRVGGVDFAILEDRKFKSAPMGNIPKMGPRPDHINDPSYDPKSIDLPGLQLLGERQEKFLREWGQDWAGATMKAVISQTAFCGAVHMHGSRGGRLLADLDCNGWPQTPRKRALEEIRRCRAVHLCGDQHLAVVAKHGIDSFGDGPYSFTSPALVNTIYGRWWHPLDEKAGPNPMEGSPLPWTGDFRDGLGNMISMMAYANPTKVSDEKQRADGYGVVRFNKRADTVTFECWPRFSDAKAGAEGQFPGWPVTVSMEKNDGRKVAGYLPELVFEGADDPVVQVVSDESGEILYTVRARGGRLLPHVFAAGRYTVKTGRNKPDGQTLTGIPSSPDKPSEKKPIKIQ